MVGVHRATWNTQRLAHLTDRDGDTVGHESLANRLDYFSSSTSRDCIFSDLQLQHRPPVSFLRSSAACRTARAHSVDGHAGRSPSCACLLQSTSRFLTVKSRQHLISSSITVFMCSPNKSTSEQIFTGSLQGIHTIVRDTHNKSGEIFPYDDCI